MEDCYTYTTKGRSPGAAAIQITASSFAQEGAKQYLPALAIDGDMNTAWCEGAEGDGLNEWIEITLPEGETFSHVEVWGGYLKSSDHLYNNGRLKRYRVSHKTHAVEVEDTTVLLTEERWPGRGFKGDYTDFVPYGHLIHDMDWTESGFTLSNPVGHVVRIDILDVTPGKKYRDTCISEIQVTLTAPSSE